MKNKTLIYALILLFASTGFSTTLPAQRGMMRRSGQIRWEDDTHYLQTIKDKKGNNVLMRVDALTGKAKKAKTPPAVTRHRVMVTSRDGNLFYSDGSGAPARAITANPGIERNPRLSPDQKHVAFTRNHDLYVIDLETNLEHRLTTDGSDLVYNGYASWVYYEEILGRGSRYAAFWWSPDSKKVAFLRFDDSPVPLFVLMRADSLHGAPEFTRYPYPGDANPVVKLGIADVNKGTVAWAHFDEHVDQYIAWPSWRPDSKELLIQVLNRDQNHMQFFMVNPGSGQVRKIYDEQRKTWVDFFEDLYVLKNGSGFILRSYRTDFENLYYYNWDGQLQAQLTDVDWRVNRVIRVDEEKGIVYFTGRGPESTENHSYRVNIDGSDMVQLTKGAGSHRINLSPGGSCLIDQWSGFTQPPRTELRNSNGKLIRVINETQFKFDPAKNIRRKYFRIMTPDGFNLPAVITYPLNFDPAKKYPVIFTIYGGPDAGGIRSSFSSSPGWYARHGIITFQIDHRASGHFGKKGLDYMWRNLGKWEMLDYEEGVKWLRKQPYVDATRMGITGGSYGGYTTCMALTSGAGYWTHGIASSSVTSWRMYDDIYTERYMDTPAQNPEGYKAGSVMTYAKNLKGKLLILHGEMDDNVHMQNSLQLVSKLEDLGKDFQFMIYPNGRHGWGGAKSIHSRNLSHAFWIREFHLENQ
ncbi:MAG: DPP IV N-terminal domain-containing protein [Bacteroidales bacterium]|nr:DPP IV N-terminal domain-containing protein [Bacteroidales bacterium]